MIGAAVDFEIHQIIGQQELWNIYWGYFFFFIKHSSYKFLIICQLVSPNNTDSIIFHKLFPTYFENWYMNSELVLWSIWEFWETFIDLIYWMFHPFELLLFQKIFSLVKLKLNWEWWRRGEPELRHWSWHQHKELQVSVCASVTNTSKLCTYFCSYIKELQCLCLIYVL